MLYTIDELKGLIEPIAKKYQISTIYLFGSYARGDADENSDVDILIKREGSIIKGLIMGTLYEELSEIIGKEIDLITEEAISQHDFKNTSPWLYENIFAERIKLYG